MGEIKANKLICEFIGTYMLVYTVGSNVVGKTGDWAVTSIACSLMVFIYALGSVSGGHFNPAVTTALGIAGKIDWNEGAVYMIVQILGGVAGGFTNSKIYNHAVGAVGPGKEFDLPRALAAEFLYTLMLAFVVLNVAGSAKNQPNEYYGLAIGFVVIAGGYGAGAVSGGCFNPAVALGLDISSLHPKLSPAYVAVELLGGAVAAGLHRACRPEDYNADEGIRKSGTSPIGAKLLSELLGTFYLCLTVGLNVAVKSKMGAWSIAASLMCMIYALGSVSGAHFNPAVTVAVLVSGRDKIAAGEVGGYIICQMIGGALGMLTGSFIGHASTFGPLGDPSTLGSITFSTIAEGHAEMMFTFVLCFVVLNVATAKHASSEMFGLAIGSCVTVGGVAVGGVTGGCLNPAVAFGVFAASAAHGKMNALGLPVFWGFQIVGALLAAGLFRVTCPNEFPEAKSDKLIEDKQEEPEEVI